MCGTCSEGGPHDWDICTSARPEETERCFFGHRMIETGLKHGTVTVLEDGEPYEITNKVYPLSRTK